MFMYEVCLKGKHFKRMFLRLTSLESKGDGLTDGRITHLTKRANLAMYIVC
jgi:hypothetical protein